MGVAYKKDIGDLRESLALDIIHLLQEKGAHVSYHDPYVPVFNRDGMVMTCVPDLDAALQAADCVVIVTDHMVYDWVQIAQQAQLVVDTRNALRR